MPRSSWPASLAFLGDCDGPADTLLAELARVAGDGLRRVFGHCRDAPGDGDLILWMTRRLQPAAATYVNRIGRTMRQIREEHALQRAIVDHVHASGADDGRRRAAQAARRHRRLRGGGAPGRAPDAQRPGGGAARVARPQRARPRRHPGRPRGARAAAAAGLARPALPAAVAGDAGPGDRLPGRRRPRRRAVGARGPRRDQPVHGLRAGEAGPLPPHDDERAAPGPRLLGAPRLRPRLPGPGPVDPRGPVGVPRRRAAAASSRAITTAASRATWTTSSTRSPGGSTSCSATA